MANSYLQVDGLTKSFGDLVLFRKISFGIAEGQRIGLIAKNGSGKTTTLNMVNGYIFPSQGHVKVLEFEFGHSSIIELRKRIGWVSSALTQFIPTHDYPLHIVLSGKFASLGLWEKVDDDDIARANEILDLLKIRHLAERKYGMLSQGEKQKVLIGRALMNHPDIIIFDEAFNGLDIFARHDMEITINELAEGNITFILVTHNTDEILPVFGKALLLKDGQVHSQGDIDDMIQYDNLSDFYGANVDVFKHKDRFYLSLADTKK